MMKFLQILIQKTLIQDDFDVCVIIGFIISTAILWATVDEAPNDFYIKHLIICAGVYTLAKAMCKLVDFVCKKLKGKLIK